MLLGNVDNQTMEQILSLVGNMTGEQKVRLLQRLAMSMNGTEQSETTVTSIDIDEGWTQSEIEDFDKNYNRGYSVKDMMDCSFRLGKKSRYELQKRYNAYKELEQKQKK